MNVIDNFLDKYSYRFPKGYPDLTDPADKKLMQELLSEIGVNLLEEDQNSELVDIFDIIGSADVITKTDVFNELAQYTLDYYGDTPEMKDLKTLFPYKVNKVPNWKSYVPENEKKDNRGKEVEVFLKNYAIKNKIKAELISGGRGKDVKIGNATVESKSDAGKNINTKLQTTYYLPNTYYAFVNDVSGDDAEVRIVSGELLRKVSLGQGLNEKADDFETELKKQIQKGLTTLPFAEMIKTALIQGPTKNTTSFEIGHRLKVRFLIFFEPAYGKERNKKNKELEKNLDEEYLYND